MFSSGMVRGSDERICTPDEGKLGERAAIQRLQQEAACKRGDLEQCVRAGDSHLLHGGSSGYEPAAQMYRDACDGGLPAGCIALAGLYRSNTVRSGNGETAVELYRRASGFLEKDCSADHPRACAGLAQMITAGQVGSTGESAADLRTKAESLYRKQCDAGTAEACSELGALYLPSDPELRNERAAIAAFEKGCVLGDASSCSYLAAAYLGGESGLAQDPAAAARYAARACEGGDMGSCSAAGVLYEGRNGPAVDANLALALLRRGCDGEDGASCYLLGEAYESGRTVVQDRSKAQEMFSRACLLGCQEACSR
jgi:TPR repeat protein